MKQFFALFMALILLSMPAMGLYQSGREDFIPYEAEAIHHSPILFIPGIMGSYLVDEHGDELWIGGVNEDRSKLMLEEDGTSPSVRGAKIRASEVMRTAFGTNVYEDFYDWMDGDWTGYGLKLYTYRGKEGKFGYLGRAYFDHAYDFRYDNQVQVKLLEKKIDEILKKTHSDKIILIAHSMGGYQARLYADKHPDKVRAIIFLSSPHHGSAKAFWAMTEGYNFGAPTISDAYTWHIGRNWPGPHQLLADQEILIGPDGNMMSTDDQFFGDWVGYQAAVLAKNMVEALEFKKAADAEKFLKNLLKGGIFSRDVMKKAWDFRKKYNAITLPSTIIVENINGINQSTDFQHQVRYENWNVAYEGGSVALPFPVLRLTAKTQNTGDGTVHFDGLQWSGAQRTQTVSAGHMKVPANVEAQKLMEEILERVNHDKRDQELVKRLADYAQMRLGRLEQQQGSATSEAENFAEQVAQMENQENRDASRFARYMKDLQGRAKSIISGDLIDGATAYRVNIVVPGMGDYGEETDFKAFIVTQGYEVTASGIGEVRPKPITVTVRDEATLDAVLSGTMRLGEAYSSGAIQVDSDIVTNMLLKAAKLANAYLSNARSDLQ